MHRDRRWSVAPVTSAEDLARMLTERTWTLCAGFYVEGHDEYLFVNDSTHEDGAGEFAVLKGRIGTPEYVQLESVTFSWASFDQALGYIQQALSGQWDGNDFATALT